MTIEKVGEEQLQTIVGKAQVLSHLVNKHSGELVELEADSDATLSDLPAWMQRPS